MKILISSHFFTPQIGGIETVTQLLAEGFLAAGHEVRVVTTTAAEAPLPFEVLRNPGPGRLLEAVRWCDVFFHSNVSLKTAWPLLLIRRPWVVTHHVWIPRRPLRQALVGAFKRWVLRGCESVAISRAIAADFDFPSTVIPNPYRASLFRRLPGVERKGDLIFVGRLVSDKGADLLLRAAVGLDHPLLTIVGDGPERPRLEALARDLGVAARFVGMQTGEALVRLLNEHRVAVIPSRWAEPFGVVALEAIACGCVVVGSSAGGLAEAIGPCGLTFPNGDVPALTACIQELLGDPGLEEHLRAQAPEHLAKHRPEAVCARYLELFSTVPL